MTEQTSQSNAYGDAVAAILEANGLGERATLANAQVTECTTDAGGNRLLMAEVGKCRYFLTLSPALKGRFVGEDRIEDEEVRLHFGVNIIGEPLAKK
jgi:hypothetical protein